MAARASDKNFEQRLFCDEHPDAELIEDYRVAEMSCSECGTILLDYTPYIPEDCMIIDNNDGIVENPLTAGLTHIYSGPKFFTGVTKHSKKEEVNGSDDTLHAVYGRIETIAERLEGSREVIEKAKHLCENIYDMINNIEQRWLPEVFAGACLFDAFLKKNDVRTFKEIHSVSNTSSHIDISKCYEKIEEDCTFDLDYSKITIEDYINQFGKNLRLPEQIINIALDIATEAKNNEQISSQIPDDLIAANSIYITMQVIPEYRNKNDINKVADKCNIAASLLRRVHEDIKNISNGLSDLNPKI